MISVDDLAFITTELTTIEENDEKYSDGEMISSKIDEESDTAYIAEDKRAFNKSRGIQLTDTAFKHGRSFPKGLEKELLCINAEISKGEHEKFKGIYIETCANKTPVMSYGQYKAYCERFHVPCQIFIGEEQSSRVIGGQRCPTVSVTIPTPFRDRNLVTYVRFQIVSDNVLFVLSMNDMPNNNLDISIQKK